MNPLNTDSVLQLRDIQLPDSTLWWPLAPGWWILLGFFVILLIGFYLYKKNNLARKMKYSINIELECYYKEYQEKSDSQVFVQQLSALLRRVSLHLFQELSIAKLQGQEWLEFLDSKLPDMPANKKIKKSFVFGVGKIFLIGPYQKNINAKLYPVYDLVEYWINYNLNSKHRNS